MKIAIDTRSTTTGNAVALPDLTQEIDGIPVSFTEGMESELEDFGEGLDG